MSTTPIPADPRNDPKPASNRSAAVGAATDDCPRCGSARIADGVCTVCGANLADVLHQQAADARRAGLRALADPALPAGRQPVPRSTSPAAATGRNAAGRRGRSPKRGRADARRPPSLLLPLALGGVGGALMLVVVLVLLVPARAPVPDLAPLAARDAPAPPTPNGNARPPGTADVAELAPEAAAARSEWSSANGPPVSAAALPQIAPLPAAPGSGQHAETRPMPRAADSTRPDIAKALDLEPVHSAGPAGVQATLGAYQRASDQAARELAELGGGGSGWTAGQGPSDAEIETLRQLAADGDDIAILTLRTIARQRRVPLDSLLPAEALAPQR